MEKKLNIIGKPTPKIDANLRVSGNVVYGQDLMLPNMLYGAILRAEYPSAKILSIDTSEAKKLEGVECVITAEDVDVNNISYRRDHPILKSGEVNCIRDEIAAVAAETKEIADQALKLIKVKYEPREIIADPFEALKNESPQINKFTDGKYENKNVAHHFHYEHGNLEEQRQKASVSLPSDILCRV